MLKYMIKKARLDFTASFNCKEKDLESENGNQDVGFEGCSQQVTNTCDEGIVLDTEADGEDDDAELWVEDDENY